MGEEEWKVLLLRRARRESGVHPRFSVWCLMKWV
jgi:hypothetical protein